MQKRVLSILLMIVVCVSLVSCGSSENSETVSLDLNSVYEKAFEQGKRIYLARFPDVEDEKIAEKNISSSLIRGNDGSYIKIDYTLSNKYSYGSKKYELQEEMNEALFEMHVNTYFDLAEYINKELGLPDSLYENMLSTNGADGKQVKEFDNIIVTWSFRADSYFQVIYEKK